jgi:UDP-3-O-[3-hydroxymyristoyl] N-acetylglucosamine deacetylase
MVLHPAAPNSGIRFRRTDVATENCEIAALYGNIASTRLCTTLANEHGIRVGTVEHLMAALAGCEIDNVVIELSGSEVPVMDGSAEPFVSLIENAGIVEQDAARCILQVLSPVSVRDGDCVATLEPADGFSVALDIEFDSSVIGAQGYDLEFSTGAFKSDICRARTFGFLHEVEAMRKAGFARGGSLDNAVVIDGDEVMNQGGLRFVDEFVRHKVLDCIGDLYLAGAPMQGKFRGVKTGHAMHHKLLCALFANDAAWAMAPMDGTLDIPAWAPQAIAASA